MNTNFEVANILNDIGMPSHLKGYYYLMDIIQITDKQHIYEVYNIIANKYNTTHISIERSIRYAIEITFNHPNYKLINDLFGHSININKGKPTNKEFIFTLSNKLKLNNINKS